MRILVEQQSGVHFIAPSGELLAGQGDAELKEALVELRSEGVRKVAIDFAGVPYIDSSILGQLVHGYSELRKMGGNLKLVNPSRKIVDVLALTRLDTVFEIFGTREEAIRGWIG